MDQNSVHSAKAGHSHLAFLQSNKGHIYEMDGGIPHTVTLYSDSGTLSLEYTNHLLLIKNSLTVA